MAPYAIANLRYVCDQPRKHIEESNLVVQGLVEPVPPGNPSRLLTVRFRLQTAKKKKKKTQSEQAESIQHTYPSIMHHSFWIANTSTDVRRLLGSSMKDHQEAASDENGQVRDPSVL